MRKQIEQLLKSISYPLFITVIEILFLALAVWGITSIIPHQIEAIKGFGFLTWCVIVVSYKIITYKYKSDEYEPEQVESQEEPTEIQIPLPFVSRQKPSVLQEEPRSEPGPTNMVQAISNIYEANKELENESTRE